ncbi:hypothetical protein FOA43_000518 [Brettanomyces nanus]|uniref:Uncharacterized protein n=1 Tax=Eeniella nana TaxID=13502 RepID=A0A875RVX4_EENNA|nr:uncharacterized protein FOA43_000518 [Brettanomyces nanus]QPG73211.1 hypothetical protein FOA43_000518 [Brettanomyces nanus]
MPNIAIVSGGTATNAILDVIQQLAGDQNHNSHSNGCISYILPISDNGGSTSEIIRVMGGCSVGDIRSRITRLIPDESSGLRDLLSYRLSPNLKEAKAEWEQIVEGSHPLWASVDPPCRQIMRSFLIHVHLEILKRSRHSAKNFRLELASVGNLFLTGARLSCGSLDSSIELVLRMTRVPSNIQVLPCINTNFTYHISALLKNGAIITGQSQISHPSLPTKGRRREPSLLKSSSLSRLEYLHNGSTVSFNDDVVLQGSVAETPDQVRNVVKNAGLNWKQQDSDIDSDIASYDSDIDDDSEMGTPSYVHPELRKSQLHFNKDDNIPLPAPIERIFYISPYGEEIYPVANSRVLNCLREANTVIYSIGSLMTSIVPILILQGVGDAILHNHRKSSGSKKKVLLVNGSSDRETYGMSALDCITVICDALNYSMLFSPERKRDKSHEVTSGKFPISSFVTHILYIRFDAQIRVDVSAIESQGVKCIAVKNALGDGHAYDLTDMYKKMDEISKSKV